MLPEDPRGLEVPERRTYMNAERINMFSSLWNPSLDDAHAIYLLTVIMVSYAVTGASYGIGLAFVQALHVNLTPRSSYSWTRTDIGRIVRRNKTRRTTSLPLSVIPTHLAS